MNLLQDTNRDGVMSQLVRRMTELEEFVRLHKIIKHQNLTVPDSNPEVVYAYGDQITVLTSETTIFSITAPANQFSALSGHLRFIVNSFFDGGGSSRTLTARLKVGATTATDAATVTLNTNYRNIYEGLVSRSGVDSQILEFTRMTINDSAGSVAFADGDRGVASEDDASPITIEFTLQLNGAVDSAKAYGVYVEWINDADMW